MNELRKETALGLIREGEELIRLGRELAKTIGLEISETSGDGESRNQKNQTTRKLRSKKFPGKNGTPRKKTDNRQELAGRPLELKNFFLTHGPSRRRIIIEKSKIPSGTISVLLNKYCDNKDGIWDWRTS